MQEKKLSESEKKKKRPAQAAAALLVFLMLMGTFVWLMWPKGPATVTASIQITCDTNWSGSIGADAQSITVDGLGSQNYQVTGRIIVAVIQKQTDTGSLTVGIIVNGESKASQTTTAAYGVVTVSWNP